MSRRIKGFDYRLAKEVEYTLAEWRAEFKALDKAGGTRAVDKAPGETWGLAKNGRLAFEVYAVIRV